VIVLNARTNGVGRLSSKPTRRQPNGRHSSVGWATRVGLYLYSVVWRN